MTTQDIREQIRRLPARDREQLVNRLRSAQRSAAARSELRPGDPEAALAPLSPAQERLYFQDLLDPGNPALNIAVSVRIRGPLDTEALEAALDAVVKRHDALRTVFAQTPDGPRQRVEPLSTVRVEHGADGARDLEGALRRHARTRLNLAEGPLLAAALYTVDEHEHVLQVVVHHIAFDGWSSSVLVDDLVEHYRARTRQRPARLEPLAVQYPDFSLWLRRRAAGARFERQLTQVRERLAGAPFVLDLPTDRPRPPAQTYNGGQAPFAIDAETTAALAALARAEGSTAYVALLSVFALVLSRASGAGEFVLGSPVSGRTRPELEAMIGCFADILVVRVAPGEAGTYRGLLRLAHNSVRHAYTSQDVPYTKIVQAIAPPRDPSRNPLFQVMFGYADRLPTRHDADAPSFTPESHDYGVTDFDLFLNMMLSDEGVFEGELRYNTDLFDPASVTDLLDRFRTVARNLALAPDTPLEQVAPLRTGTIALAAPFPAEPLLPALRDWARYLGLPVGIEFGAPGPLSGQLLDRDGVLRRRPGAAHAALLRWEDLARGEQDLDTQDRTAVLGALDRGIAELCDALAGYRSWSVDPLTFVLCPPSLAWATPFWAEVFDGLTARLSAACERYSGIRVATSVTGPAPQDPDDDEYLDEMACIPYAAPEFFDELGGAIARALLPLAVWTADGPAAEIEPLWPSRVARSILPAPADGADPAPFDAGPVGSAAQADRREPRADTERRLAVLWQEVLKVDRVALDDNFFALGGHSFLAVELLARIKAEFGRTVEPFKLFSGPTLAQLAELVESAPQTTAGPALVAVPRDGPLPLSSTQRRLWTLAKVHGGDARHNSSFSIRLDGELDEAALRASFTALIRRHEVLRSTIVDRDGEPELRIAPDSVALPDRIFPPGQTVPPDSGQQAEIGRLLEAAAAEPFDLENGPLVRIRLYAAGPTTHYVCMVMHHAVIDNQSWVIFLRELAELYAQAAAGRVPDLPALPAQFADYAHWQSGWLAGDEAAEQAGRWRELMRGAPPLSALPTDFPHAQHTDAASGQVTHRVDAGLTDSLRAVGRRLRIPLFSVVLTGFQLMVRQCTAQESFVIGTVNANREHGDLASVLGDFADLIPIRLTPSAELTIREQAGQVHQAILDARALQRLPFENIIAAARVGRVPRRHPLFQTLVNFVDGKDELPEFAGLRLTSVPWLRAATEYDLFFSVNAEDDELLVTLDYATGLYTPDGARAMLEVFTAMLTAVADRTEESGGSIPLPADCRLPALPAESAAEAAPPRRGRLAVASSFTAEALGPALGFWLELFGRPAAVAFAPYGQVLQQLLDPAGVFDAVDGDAGAAGDGAVHAVLLRWEDWVRHGAHDRQGSPERLARDLESAFADLRGALAAYRSRCSAPLVIAVCPASPAWSAAPWLRIQHGLTERLAAFCAGLPGVRVLDAELAARPYPVDAWHDEQADRLAHLPYTPEFSTVLGTVLARSVIAFAAACRSLYLEPGRLFELGEDPGSEAQSRNAVIARAVRRAGAGAGRRVVLGGADEGVRELLERRAELLAGAPLLFGPVGCDPLDRFAAAVAAGQIEPAGCVVLDPDPEICAGIRARFPEVLAVAVPRAADAARALLEHVWALDLPSAAEGGTHPEAGLRILAELTDPAAIHAATVRGHRRGSQGGYVAPRNEREQALAGILAGLLGVDRVGAADSFLELGGDSMTAIQVVSHAARAGIALTPRLVLESESVASLAAAPEAPAPQSDQGPVVGPVPLTSAQLWFFENPAAAVSEPGHYNHPYYLTVRPGITPEHLRRALRHLVDHHDALRLRFTADAAGTWSQRAEEPGVEIPFEQADLSDLPADRREAAAERFATAAQRGLDLGAGPLVRAVHLRMGGGEPDRLLIVCHHLVVDGISRGILLEDLSTLCGQAEAGQELSLPAKTTSYRDWALLLAEYAESPRLLAETPFWLGQLAGGPDAPIPVDFPDGANTFDAVETVGAALSEQETAALQRLAGRELRSTLADVVLGVTAAVLAQWSGDPTHCRIALAGHGRQDELGEVDLSRTVGWFQVFSPMNLGLRAADDRELVRSVRAQLEAAPTNGLGFSALESLRSTGPARRLFAAGTRPRLSYNYLGEYGFGDASAHTSLFGVCPRPSGPAQGEGYVWPYLLDVMPGIVGRSLSIDIHYRHTIHRRETVAAIAQQVVDRLRALLT